MQNGPLFFGILSLLAGLYLARKVRAPSTEAEPNNPEFVSIGTGLSICFGSVGIGLIYLGLSK